MAITFIGIPWLTVAVPTVAYTVAAGPGADTIAGINTGTSQFGAVQEQESVALQTASSPAVQTLTVLTPTILGLTGLPPIAGRAARRRRSGNR